MTGGHERILVARVGAELVAFPLHAVREVIDAPVVDALPLTPDALVGHMTLRDSHIPVLDAGVLLGIASARADDGIALVFGEGFVLRLDDAVDVWERDAASVLPVPPGTDRLGVLRALLRRDEQVAALVDTTVLRARALAILREDSPI